MGSIANTKVILWPPIQNNGTFTAPYPAGTTQAFLQGSDLGELALPTGESFPQGAGAGQVEFAFGPSSITVTNRTGLALFGTVVLSFGRIDIKGAYHLTTPLKAQRVLNGEATPVEPEIPVVPLPQVSSLYFDNTDAPIGDVSTLTTRGSWGAVLTNAAFTGGAVAQMEADGLRTRGNILRNISTQGPLRKITILADVLRTGITNGGRGDVITINPNLAADFRFYLQFDANRFMVTGPNGVIINMASQWGYGARHVVGVELDLVAGTMTVMEPDGDTQTAVVSAVPLTIGRIEVGKAAASLIYKLALVTEAAA